MRRSALLSAATLGSHPMADGRLFSVHGQSARLKVLPSLSAEYLTSNLALAHLLSYLKTHRKLFDEISDKVGDIWGVEDLPDESDDDNEDPSHGGSNFDDDTDIPMRAVVQACLDLDIDDAPNPAAEFVVDIAGVVADKDGDLISTSPEEQVHQLNDVFVDSEAESDSEGDVDSEDSD
jgi:hypothetical protein